MAGKGYDVVNEYGDGVAWIRGSIVGKGSFGRVYKATLRNNRKSKHSYLPSVMAVKSAEVSVSGTIQKEREVMSNLNACPYLIKCFGDETTVGDNGVMAYNLLLEYASAGTLADRIKKSGRHGLPELEARVHTRSILRGLNHIHGIGYVHCDLKPDNILLVPKSGRSGFTEFTAKIGDFGLAKRVKLSKKRKLGVYWRGTPMYLSPEAVIDSVQDASSDVWAVGCIVLEMLTGKPAWDGKNAEDIFAKIGTINELPKLADEISKDARDFLKRCFVRKPMYRFTCEMLLNHPFVEGLEIDDDDDGVEELEGHQGLNETESMALVGESDDEFSCDLFSDESDENSFSYYASEEDAKNTVDECLSSSAEEKESAEVELSDGVTISSGTDVDVGFDQSNELSERILSQSIPKRRQHCPVNFSIPAGV